ncbi:MAG: type VI secretion system-associated FHA domain protein TagH [Pseudomonadota bacterium]|nr:type VI secretion system-associated FHA domain protein TagH [Pseudomonadota bacterium]
MLGVRESVVQNAPPRAVDAPTPSAPMPSAPMPGAAPITGGPLDPLLVLGGAPATAANPFADLMQVPGAAPSVPAGSAQSIGNPPPVAALLDTPSVKSPTHAAFETLASNPFSDLAGAAPSKVDPSPSNPFSDLLGAAPSKLETSASNPFSDLAGAAPSKLDASASSPLSGLAGSAPSNVDASASNPFSDLLGAPPSSLDASASNPFSDLVGAAPSTNSGTAAGAGDATQMACSWTIPEDFDPFALPSSMTRNTDDPLRGISSSANEIDSIAHDPQHNELVEFVPAAVDQRDSLHGGPPSMFDPIQSVDPLGLFGGDEGGLVASAPKAETGEAMPDQLPELGSYFRPPRIISATGAPPRADAVVVPEPMLKGGAGWSGSAAPQRPAAPVTAPAPLIAPAPPSVESHPRANPAQKSRGADELASQAAAMPSPAPHGVAKALAEPGPFAPRAGTQPLITATSDDTTQLLNAFLQGARVEGLAVTLTPAVMEMIGTLVYHAIAGAMQLVAARQITKHEMRAEVTIIVPKGNNPLKFLPTPEAAIMQMLGPNMPGFKPTAASMQEVFEDLQAHELGVIAGMRAAMAQLLNEFDPASLESGVVSNGALDGLLPGARQVKLWRLFEQRYKALRAKAQEEAELLFGEAFTRAYEEEVRLGRRKE